MPCPWRLSRSGRGSEHLKELCGSLLIAGSWTGRSLRSLPNLRILRLWFYEKQGGTGPSSQPVLVMPLLYVSEADARTETEKPWRTFLCVHVLFVPQGSVCLGSKGMYTTPCGLRPKQRTCCLMLPSPYTNRKEEGKKPFHASAFLMGYSSNKRNGYCRWSIE